MILSIVCGIISILVVVGIAWLCSDNKKNISIRTLVTGIAIPIILLLFFEKISIGIDMLNFITNAFMKVVGFGNVGIEFIFGKQLMSSSFGVFFITSLMPVVYMCSIIYFLYYIRVIPFLIKIIGKTIGKIMNVDGGSMTVTLGNGILAGSESPIFAKTLVDGMTKSQLFTVLVTGISSTALSILPAYAGLHIPMNYLVVNNIVSIFTGLVISKIMIPETEYVDMNIEVAPLEEETVMGAITSGAFVGFDIAVKVSASIIAILGMLALVNSVLGLVHLSLPEIFGWIFLPIVKMLGIPGAYQGLVAHLSATKLYSNEFIAFITLGKTLHTLPVRVQMESVAMLQNFANISIIGITLGSMRVFAPSKKASNIINKNVWKALFAGLLSSIMLTGMIAIVMA